MRLPAAFRPLAPTCRIFNPTGSTRPRVVPVPLAGQQRWVGTKYLAKVALINEQWAEKARKTEAGELQYFWDFLVERGFIKDVVGDPAQLKKLFNVKRVAAYCGVDPTGPSLHVGHLVAFMPIFHMYLAGYPAFTLLGGATAKIGDPTGRLKTRVQEPTDTYRSNLFTINYQLKQLWQNVEEINRVRYGWERKWHHRRGVENNGVWWNKLPLFEILSYLSTDLRMGPLLSRDTVKTKMEQGDGMSFNEFIYPIMQAWDWWTLWSRLSVQVQIGGSDQYGNIVTGADIFKIIRKNEPDPAKKIPPGLLSDPVGFTVPLLTAASGEKFGKSANNAIWLDPFKCPSADLYGYFMKQSDEKVKQLLNLLTFMPTAQVNELHEEHMKDPPKRLAHHKLAYEVVWLCHGKAAAIESQQRHLALHGGPAELVLDDQSTADSGQVLHTTLNNRPQMDMQLPRSLLERPISHILVAVGFAETKAEGSRLAKAQGAYIGGKPGQGVREVANMPMYQMHWTPVKEWIPSSNVNFIVDEKYLFLRKGKHNIRIIELVSDEVWKRSGKTYPGEVRVGEFRSLREELRKAEASVKSRQEGGEQIDIDAELESLQEAGRRSGLIRGSENAAIQFPAANDRAARAWEVHGQTMKKVARMVAQGTGKPPEKASRRRKAPWEVRGSTRDAEWRKNRKERSNKQY